MSQYQENRLWYQLQTFSYMHKSLWPLTRSYLWWPWPYSLTLTTEKTCESVVVISLNIDFFFLRFYQSYHATGWVITRFPSTTSITTNKQHKYRRTLVLTKNYIVTMQYICTGSNYLYYFSGLALLLFHFLFYCHFVTVFKISESNDLFTTLSYYCLGTHFE